MGSLEANIVDSRAAQSCWCMMMKEKCRWPIHVNAKKTHVVPQHTTWTTSKAINCLPKYFPKKVAKAKIFPQLYCISDQSFASILLSKSMHNITKGSEKRCLVHHKNITFSIRWFKKRVSSVQHIAISIGRLYFHRQYGQALHITNALVSHRKTTW